MAAAAVCCAVGVSPWRIRASGDGEGPGRQGATKGGLERQLSEEQRRAALDGSKSKENMTIRNVLITTWVRCLRSSARVRRLPVIRVLCGTRLLLPAGVVALAVAGGIRSATAQEAEQILARMEFERMRLYSGPGVNYAILKQNAFLAVEALGFAAARPMSLRDTRWRAIGPSRIDAEDFAPGGRFAGRVSTIAIHPADPNILFVGGAQGGVWRSDNGGLNWTPLTDGECSLAMGSIAIDPVDPRIVYAGTGEQHFSGDSYYGCGVLRSLDGGATWQQLGGDVFVRRSSFIGRGGMGTGGARIARVVVDRASAGSPTTTTVLVASSFGLYRSTSSGAGWSLVLEGYATDVVANPDDPSVLYAALAGEGIYRSSDGGESWTYASESIPRDGTHRTILAISHSDPDVLYAGVVLLGESRRGADMAIYRTEDGGGFWEPLPAEGASCFGQCWYDFTMAVHPDGADTVFLGTLDLYRSNDGGRTFNSVLADNVYVDQHHLVFDTLSDPYRLYVGNDGGVFRSLNGGLNWQGLNTNLAVAQFYRGISLHPSDPVITLGGTQDQGTLRPSGGTLAWDKIMGGDGGYTAIDAENPDVWYAETQWIAGAGYVGPRKNGNRAVEGIDIGENALFIPPLVMDPVDSRRLYFGTETLYRTDNAARDWTAIYSTPDDSVITAIAPSPASPNTVYAAIRAGRIVATHDGGETWLEAGPAQGLPDRWIGGVAAHPNDPDQAYAAAGGFLSGHVFQTTDGGRSWRDRTGDLPDHPVNSIIYDPADPEAIYLGTDFGVFHSPAGGGTWNRLQDGLPVSAVYDVAAQPGTGRLVAATHGRGMFELAIDVPLSARVRPNSFVDTVRVSDPRRIPNAVIVAPRGRNDFAAGWNASSDASWLVLPGGSGTGRGRFDFQIAAADLASGDHEGVVSVVVDGIADPVRIPVSLHVPLASELALVPGGPARSILVGSTEPFADSVRVVFTGPRPATRWNAEFAGGPWAEVGDVVSGAGDGAVTWTVDPGGLEVGVYVDTVRVEAEYATGSPAMVLDSFAVKPPLGVAALRSTVGYGVAGWTLAPRDSLDAGLLGFEAELARWTAGVSGGEWLTVVRAAGAHGEAVVWTRASAALEAGVHEDTITVRVQGRPEISGLIADRFEVVEGMTVRDAAHHVLGLDRLEAGQVRFLDWFGNRDGTFNAGDVLRWLDYCASGGSGCPAGTDRVGRAGDGAGVVGDPADAAVGSGTGAAGDRVGREP